MVLVDRSVVFVDELDEVVKELGGLPLRESMNSALRAVPPDLSDDELREWQYTAKEQVWARHAKLEEEAFDILIEREATTHPCAARKEPLLPQVDGSIYHRLSCAASIHVFVIPSPTLPASHACPSKSRGRLAIAATTTPPPPSSPAATAASSSSTSATTVPGSTKMASTSSTMHGLTQPPSSRRSSTT
jgi:hypothetical protein